MVNLDLSILPAFPQSSVVHARASAADVPPKFISIKSILIRLSDSIRAFFLRFHPWFSHFPLTRSSFSNVPSLLWPFRSFLYVGTAVSVIIEN